MIYQYDATQKTGLIMLSDGESQAFSSRDWVDNEHEPKVGQKISYEKSQHRIEIKVTNEDNSIKTDSVEVLQTEPVQEDSSSSDEQKLSSVDEYIEYYQAMGFKLLTDIGDEELRTATLRMYTAHDYGEAIIKKEGLKISVTQMINGKTETIG